MKFEASTGVRIWHHSLERPIRIASGELYETDDPAEIAALSRDRRVSAVEGNGDDEDDLAKLSRAELDERAEDAGLDPADYRTKADVIAALEE